MQRSTFVLCATLLAGCASEPVAPPFHAADLAAPAAKPVAAEVPVDFDGVQPATASQASSSAATPLDDQHITVSLGVRKLEEDTADDLDVDHQVMVGVGFDAKDRGSGNGFEVGVSHSQRHHHVGGETAGVELNELYGGFRKTFITTPQEVEPYVAVGASLLHGDVDVGPASDDDTTLGAYLRLGVDWALDGRTRMGVDYRHLFGHLHVLGDEFDADFDELALTVGFPF